MSDCKKCGKQLDARDGNECDACAYLTTPKPLDKEPFMAAMRAAKHCDGDAEIAHKMADDVLCEFLIALGHEDLVELWNDVEKWYA